MAFIDRLNIGVQRHPLRFLIESGLTYGAIWTFLDSISQLLPQLTVSGGPAYACLVIASVSIGLWRAVPKKDVRYRIGGSNTYLRVRFGDLFEAIGLRAIPANEFFDSAIGDHVSPRSLHGMLLERILGGHAEAFDRCVADQLATVPHEHVARPTGHLRRYPLGTGFVLPANEDKYLVFAAAHTDTQTLKAHATVPDVWQALQGLWRVARIHCGGQKVCVPLVGGGLAGVGLPAQHLLHLIVMSAIEETKLRQICPEIEIVLHESVFSDIDLSQIGALVR